MESATATDELTLVIKLSKPHPDTHRQLFDDCHIRAFPPETFDTLDDANELIGTRALHDGRIRQRHLDHL